jgi:membrane-bound lytic murein transglycosylase D
LKKNDIPEDMAFLPLIESGFNPNAYSQAKAAGYWQFIASTAKRYGLQIDWWRDERRDPVKSTVAAANYLRDLYEMFGSWNLAMAAYNAGEGKIMRALKKTKVDDYWSLLPTNQIKRETKDYVPKFIAASLIAYSPEEYGFDDLAIHPPLSYEIVTLHYPIDLAIAADCAETSLEIIRGLNPELRRWCTPPDLSEYDLRIPQGTREIFFKNLSGISEKKRFTVDIYTVKKKDTFRKISKKTGVPVAVILDLNDMEKIMPLTAGTKIYLPPKGKYVRDTQKRAIVKKASVKKKKRTVVRGKGSKSATSLKKPATKI